MAKFICSSCSDTSSSWYGRCPTCGEWNSMQEFKDNDKKSASVEKANFIPFNKLKTSSGSRIKTGVFEFDRVLGGGFLGGEVILLAGEPGVGKSTLLLKTLQNLNVIYASGEESGEQIRHRADRIGVDLTKFQFSDSVQVEGFLEELSQHGKSFDVVVIDSIQTVYSKDSTSTLGSMSQVKDVSAKLIEFAKKNNKAFILVGHITKGGEIAGPKMLEHMVDCVLYFEGEKTSPFRILRSLKNRFGPTDEVGVFEMKETGLVEVATPVAFVDSDKETSVGKAIVGVTEGTRPLFFEVQSLCVPTSLAVPRRVVSGFDYNRIQLLLAVIKKNLKLPLDKFEVFVNVVGGVSIKSTAADLGIVASIISSMKNLPLPKSSVFIGEVGLLGEIRHVLGEDKIGTQALRYGFKTVYAPKSVATITALSKMI